MSSSAAPAHQPAPSPSGRISLLFDVIDAASISYADAVHAIAQHHGSALPPPPHWSHKGTARAGVMLFSQALLRRHLSFPCRFLQQRMAIRIKTIGAKSCST